MRILNVRLGFATNSSSTHSIVVVDKKYKDKLYGDYFGWERFVLASKKQKKRYLAATLATNLVRLIGKDEALKVTKAYTGVNLEDPYMIDHQSIICLPTTWDEKFIDIPFFEALSEYILRDDIVIVGGNDNEYSESLPVSGRMSPLPFYDITDIYGPRLVARYDEEHGYWTVFNRDSGTKVRFEFDGGK